MVEQVEYEGNTLALIIRSSYRAEGIQFFTPDRFSQQLAYMNRPQGYLIKPHTHREVRREVVLTQEVLLIRKGRVRVDFYDKGENYLESRVLEQGDVILLADGGHGFKMLEDTEMIEVKQGPYDGVGEKQRFPSIRDDDVVLGGS